MNTQGRPLPDLLRPQTLDDVIGQEHLVGKNGVIRKLLEQKFIPSMILWGPPGVGKTTLARVIAEQTDAVFEAKSAVTSGLDDIRKVIKEAKTRLAEEKKRTLLFIDEIHRFSKSQQDALLPHVEDGTVIFIGATTENPSFEVISPLLSRCRVFVLKQLQETDLNTLTERGLMVLKKELTQEARTLLLSFSNGDGRQLLTILEIAAQLLGKIKVIELTTIEDAAQKKNLQYDTNGEEHYNTISAFIKSMRASDVDAALYYLARMVEAGEDPLFIARRMIVFASEDIGMAQPTALVVANGVFRACEVIGFPECRENLAHGVVYLSLAKKDRSAYDAYMAALADVQAFGNLPIPLNVRNAPTKLMKDLGYGTGYNKYDTESHLPDKIKGKKYYQVNK